MGVYDQAARYTVKRHPAGFFAWLAPRFVSAWTFLGWLDTSTIAFPGEPDRICDTVGEFAHAADPGRRCLLDVEFQSEPHPDMLERLGEYGFRLRRELRYGPGQAGKYPVVSVLLNLTGPEQAAGLDLRIAELDGAGLQMQTVRRTLREEDAAATLAGIAGGQLDRYVLPWIPLMRGAGEAAIIDEWKRLAAQEPASRKRADYGGLALVFAMPAGRAAVWRRALEGWNMQECEIVSEWQEQARAEEAIARTRANLLRALQLRFQTPLPADLAAAIAALNDLEEVSRWFDASQTADSLAAFRAAVGR